MRKGRDDVCVARNTQASIVTGKQLIIKTSMFGTQNMFPGNSIVCLVSVNRESDCCNVPSFVVVPRDTKVTPPVFPASVT